MTESQARRLFDKTCEKLHAAGWEIDARIRREADGCTVTIRKELYQPCPVLDDEDEDNGATPRDVERWAEDMAASTEDVL